VEDALHPHTSAQNGLRVAQLAVLERAAEPSALPCSSLDYCLGENTRARNACTSEVQNWRKLIFLFSGHLSFHGNLPVKPPPAPLLPSCLSCRSPVGLTFKFCSECGASTVGTFAAMTQGQSIVGDLSGKSEFTLTARIQTNAAAGTIVGRAFEGGLWRSGGAQGQGKMLFLRSGRLAFDIG